MESMINAVARSIKVLVASCLVAFLGIVGIGAAQGDPAPADPAVLTTMTSVSVGINGSNAMASGKIVTTTGMPVVGVNVAVTVDGQGIGSGATNGEGQYTVPFPTPAAGTHLAKASFSGDATHSPSSNSATFTVAPPVQAKPKTTIQASLDPATAPAGTPLSVAGTLTTESGTAVGSAQVSISTSWGETTAAVTGDDGGFAASVTLPSQAAFPANYTVTASFAGDNVFQGSTSEVPIALQAAASASAPATDPAATTSQVVSSASNTPGLGSSAGSGTFPSVTTNVDLKPVFVIFLAVAGVAVLAFVALGVVSNRNHRLAWDERRGFGSDFGQHEH